MIVTLNKIAPKDVVMHRIIDGEDTRIFPLNGKLALRSHLVGLDLTLDDIGFLSTAAALLIPKGDASAAQD